MADTANNNNSNNTSATNASKTVLKTPDAIQKAENNIDLTKKEKANNENLEMLQYYMRLAVPIKKEKKVQEDKAKRNSDGTLALKDGKKQMEKVTRTYYETVGYKYSNIKTEDGTSLTIDEWVKDCFGDKITLNKEDNTITVKEEKQEETKK